MFGGKLFHKLMCQEGDYLMSDGKDFHKLM